QCRLGRRLRTVLLRQHRHHYLAKPVHPQRRRSGRNLVSVRGASGESRRQLPRGSPLAERIASLHEGFMKRWHWSSGLACFLLLPLACGPSGPRLYKVSGTVTLDGVPVPDGDVILTAIEPIVSADGGKIQDGAFQFLAKAGKKKVVIQASRLLGQGKGALG